MRFYCYWKSSVGLSGVSIGVPRISLTGRRFKTRWEIFFYESIEIDILPLQDEKNLFYKQNCIIRSDLKESPSAPKK